MQAKFSGSINATKKVLEETDSSWSDKPKYLYLLEILVTRKLLLSCSFGRELPYQAVQKPLVLKEEVVKANALVR